MKKSYFPTLPNNNHLKKLEQLFGNISPEPLSIRPATSYVFLCYTNRSGSNYLAALLASSGKYNLAGEDLNWETVKTHAQVRKLVSFAQYFEFLGSHIERSNHVFIKTAPLHLEVLGRAGVLDQLRDRVRYILIERADKLSQAISHAIAFATGRYTAWMQGTKRPEDVEYSQSQIDQILAGVAEAHKQFDIFFGKNGIVPVNAIYEQVASQPEQEVRRIARELGLPDIDVHPSKIRLERQASSINEAWRKRYLSGNS